MLYSMQKRLDRMLKRLGSMQKRLDSMQKRLDSMQKRLDSMPKRLDGMLKRLGSCTRGWITSTVLPVDTECSHNTTVAGQKRPAFDT